MAVLHDVIWQRTLHDILGPSGGEKTQISVNRSFPLSISIESGGRRGVTIPFTELSIRDGFENGKTPID